METIGKRISHARENKSYSIKQLAQRIGVKADTVEAWEHDERDPRANRLLNLAGALDVNFAWLMIGDQYARNEPDGGRLEIMQAKLHRIRQVHTELGALVASLEEDATILATRDRELEALAEIDEKI